MEQCITNMNFEGLNSDTNSKDEIINDSSNNSNIDSQNALSPDPEISTSSTNSNGIDIENAESGFDSKMDQ